MALSLQVGWRFPAGLSLVVAELWLTLFMSVSLPCLPPSPLACATALVSGQIHDDAVSPTQVICGDFLLCSGALDRRWQNHCAPLFLCQICLKISSSYGGSREHRSVSTHTWPVVSVEINILWKLDQILAESFLIYKVISACMVSPGRLCQWSTDRHSSKWDFPCLSFPLAG